MSQSEVGCTCKTNLRAAHNFGDDFMSDVGHRVIGPRAVCYEEQLQAKQRNQDEGGFDSTPVEKK